MPNCELDTVHGMYAGRMTHGQHEAFWLVDGKVSVCDTHLRDVVHRGSTSTVVHLDELRFAICSNCGSKVQRYLPLDSTDAASVSRCDSCPPAFARSYRNAQVGDGEATTVAIHPKTGEVSYYAMQPGQPLPDALKSQGYERVQFRSVRNLERFSRSQGVVNDFELGRHSHDSYDDEREFVEARKRHRDRQDSAHAQIVGDSRELRKRGIRGR